MVSTIVLPILVYDRTGSPFLTGLVGGVRVFPYLVVGLVAGPVADRHDRRKLLLRGNLAQGALMAVIPLVGLAGPVPIPVVFAVALAAATVFVFEDAAAFGALPSFVARDLLPRANGALTAIQAVAAIAGPALGGALAVSIGTTSAVWVDAASFVVAAAFLVGVPVGGRPDTAGGGDEPVTLVAHARRAVGFIRSRRVVATLILTGFGNSFAFGAVLGLLVPFAVERLGSAEDGPTVTALFVADALGALAAAAVFSRLYSIARIRWLSPACMSVAAASTLGLAATGTTGVALACVALASFGASLTISTGITYRQQATPPSLTSSVNVMGRMVSWGGQPIGAAVCGLVGELASVGTAYAVAGTAVGVAGIGAFVSMRGAERDPDQAGSGPGTSASGK
jgi:MFS family permease